MKSRSPFRQDKCATAWAKFKEGYTKRKSKTSMRRNDDGKLEKYEKPIDYINGYLRWVKKCENKSDACKCEYHIKQLEKYDKLDWFKNDGKFEIIIQ